MSKTTECVHEDRTPDSALRLELRAGEWVLWEGRVHRFEGLKGGRARITESGSGDLREVSVTELRGVPSLPNSDLAQ